MSQIGKSGDTLPCYGGPGGHSSLQWRRSNPTFQWGRSMPGSHSSIQCWRSSDHIPVWSPFAHAWSWLSKVKDFACMHLWPSTSIVPQILLLAESRSLQVLCIDLKRNISGSAWMFSINLLIVLIMIINKFLCALYLLLTRPGPVFFPDNNGASRQYFIYL